MDKEIGKDEINISKSFVYVILGIIALVVVVMLVSHTPENPGIATVNGEIITLDDLNKVYDSMPEQSKLSVNKSDLLNQLVQIKLIYQAAKKQNLVVDEKKVKQEIDKLKLSSGLSDEQFYQSLSDRGISKEDLEDQYSKQLTVSNFINVNLVDKIKVTDDAIEKYYNDSIDKFKIGEQVVVRHILIGEDGLNETEQDKKAQDILANLTKENFCDKVKEFTSDVASADTCGEYKFGRDDSLVEEFKKLSFDQNVGDIGIVRSKFGLHIIWTKEKIKPETKKLEEVSDSIKQFIKLETAKKEFGSFYDTLKSNSDVEISYKNN